MKTIDLSGQWKLRAEFLDVGADRYVEVLNRPEGKFEVLQKGPNVFPTREGWINASVPCDVLVPLVENGIIEEPLNKTNTKDCYWVKDLSWWFYKEFHVSSDLLEEEKVFLNFDVLDHKADIILNGIPIGKHRNTFVPFREEVKRFLKEGDNYILIRLTSGIEDHLEKDSISYYCASPHATQDRRIYLRKPQFSYGWDWCKPVPTCGIGRNAYLQAISGASIDGAYVYTKEITDDKAYLGVEVTIDNLCEYSSDDAKLEVNIKYDDEVVWSESCDLHINGGLNFWDTIAEIDNPKLWWPNGMGKQELYTVEIRVTCRGVTNEYKPFKIGIRTIKLNQDRINENERLFAVEVNGVKTFCKGGNWVPADSVYLRITDEKYETLVREAAEANFNMLRMWGGGLYEPDVFYEKCSEYGIMLMHDFMYACAFYPDHLEWFEREATREADYQTKRLRNYACMAVWTGNNEIHESITDWFRGQETVETFHGAKIFNYIQPKAVRDNCRYIPYQPSSPFGGAIANSQEIGDSHVWRWLGRDESTRMKFRFELEAFDRLYTKFMSEFGFHGPLKKSSVIRFHDGEEVVYKGEIWTHHGEQEGKHNAIAEAIDRHLTDYSNLDMDGYLLYGGLLQGSLYKELAESLRYKEYCHGDLIWMYNDCWPETGWTIIDYYLTRKVSFYFLKRAFAHTMFILRQEDDKINVVGINETPEDISVDVEYGYVSFDGSERNTNTTTINLPAFSRRVVLTFDCCGDTSVGTHFIQAINNHDILSAVSLRSYYRDYKFPEPAVKIVDVQRKDNLTRVTVKSDNFVPFVYLDLRDDIKLSDNYFHMLPGEEKVIDVYADLEEQDIVLNTAPTKYKGQ